MSSSKIRSTSFLSEVTKMAVRKRSSVDVKKSRDKLRLRVQLLDARDQRQAAQQKEREIRAKLRSM